MFLTEEQLNFYKENGYISLSNIFTEAEIQACSEEYDRLFEEKKKANQDLEATWTGDWKNKLEGIEAKPATTVLSIHNLQCHSAVFTRMLTNENLADAVADLIGSPNVLLHHTKAHVKPPEVGSPYPTHQDYYYFPYKHDTMVAAFINLDDIDPKNGGLAVFPGSHKLGPLENKSSTPTYFHVDQEKYPLKDATPIHSKRGEVLIFSYLLIHGSFPNISNRHRRMFLVQLMSADDEPLELVHQSPCQGMVLRGVNKHRDGNLQNSHNSAPLPTEVAVPSANGETTA